MINQPKYGSDEYYAWKDEERKDEARQWDYQEKYLRLNQEHELALKQLDVKTKELKYKTTQAEVGLKATVRVLLQVPLVALTIIPITVMVLFRRPIPPNLWRLIELPWRK